MAVIARTEEVIEGDALIMSSGAFEHLMDFIISNSSNDELIRFAKEYQYYYYLDLYEMTWDARLEFVRMIEKYSASIIERDGQDAPYAKHCAQMCAQAKQWFSDV